MINNAESRKNLLRSLFASSIFLIILKPILEFVWKIIAEFSKYTYFNASDYLYKNAALGQRNWIDFLMWTGVTIFFFLKTFRGTEILKSKLIAKRKEVEENKKAGLPNESKFYKYGKFIYKYSLVLDILMFLPIVYIIMLGYSDLQLNTSFNQRLNCVAPFIDENQEELLRANWAKMDSRKDFGTVNNMIEKIAKENGVILPDNLLN